MATSHDNFFVTNLIDRATRQVGRVRDIINGTASSRVEFTGSITSGELAEAEIYAMTATGSTVSFELSASTLALGTEESPYFITIKDEGGDAVNNNIVVTCENGVEINNTPTMTMNVDYGARSLYSNGIQWYRVS